MGTTEVAPAFAPEDPTLPKPWTGLIDGNTGVLYYWNPETNATQYEKPAVLPPPMATVPPSTSTPKLAPIPTARSQTPNENALPQPDLGRQVPQLQPMHQMPNHQAHHMPNQPNQQYPHMQVNQMAQSQFSNANEHSVPHYQGQQQHGLPIGNHQLQQNVFPMERDLRRQVGEPVGFSVPPIQHTDGPSGDHRFTGPAPHIPRTPDYSVHPEQHFGRPPSTGSGGAFSELQQMGPDAIHRQQPNQMGNATSRPPMGQKATYGEEQRGRGMNEFYSSSSKEGPMMFQNQQQHGSILHAGNHQDIRMAAIPHPVTSGHSVGVNMGQEIAMPKSHDHAGFPNMAPRVPSQKMFGSSDFTNVTAADSYCKRHEITVTGDNVPDPFTTFESTGFAPEILREMRYLLQSRAYVVRCAAIHPSTQQLVCP